MRNFWSHRSWAKGFSIEGLAREYRTKISRSYDSSCETSNQISNNSNLISIREEVEKISIENLYLSKNHWANRDFSEYKEAA